MGTGKLKKWNENKTFSHVFEPPLENAVDGQDFMKGEWHEKVFGNQNPITLELGCGKGEYTVELARRYPHRNFIGVDIKGHRFNRGAKISEREGLKNVAFLRTRLEFINRF
jgi:tRNA (guanine-N7-)-methyltransferase